MCCHHEKDILYLREERKKGEKRQQQAFERNLIKKAMCRAEISVRTISGIFSFHFKMSQFFMVLLTAGKVVSFYSIIRDEVIQQLSVEELGAKHKLGRVKNYETLLLRTANKLDSINFIISEHENALKTLP